MFVDLPKAPAETAARWNVPIDLRLRTLFSRPRRVAWLYENPDTSTFRYRAFNMVEALAADPAQRIGATWFSGDELAQVERICSKLETIVVARFRYSAALDRLLTHARRAGVRILFDSDDLVFDLDYAHLVADTLAQDTESSATWDYWFAYMGRLNAAARLCDGGITTNQYLGTRMSKTLEGKPVSVIPNFLNRQQQAYSLALLEAKRSIGWRRQGPLTVGYFSGSPTHNRDFAIAAPSLAHLLATDPDVRVRVVGYLDKTGPLAHFKDRIEILPHMDYVSLQRAIAEVEINIAPLQENAFTNCKSELKFFEAAAVGTWTIATPTSTFRAAIDDGKTGRLARAHEWGAALDEAVALTRDTAAYIDRAEEAARFACRTYGWDQLTSTIVRAVSTELELSTDDT